MPKVYITQLPTRQEGGAWVPTVDVSPAKEFGELVFALPAGGINYPNADMAIKQLEKKLDAFTPEDFLLPMGDPIVMVSSAAILGARMQAFKVLKWDRITRRYSAFTIRPERNYNA